jgi:hypothetical protein
MTNSAGVITGMPSVATVAAGVSTTLRTAMVSSDVNGNPSTFVVPTGSNATSSGIFATSSVKVSTGGAVAKEPAFGRAGIVGAAVAAMVALL